LSSFIFCDFWIFASSGEKPSKVLLDLIALYNKTIIYQWIQIFARFISSKLYSFKMISFAFGACFALQPFDKCIQNFHQNLGMSCDVSTSLLCKNTFWPLEILSSTPTFPIWSSRHFCTTTHLNISLKILPSVWRCQWMHTIQLYAKTQ